MRSRVEESWESREKWKREYWGQQGKGDQENGVGISRRIDQNSVGKYVMVYV